MSVHVFVQKISSKNLFLLVLASMLWSCRFSVTERKETKRRVKKNATLQRRGRTQACSQACSHPSSRVGVKIKRHHFAHSLARILGLPTMIPALVVLAALSPLHAPPPAARSPPVSRSPLPVGASSAAAAVADCSRRSGLFSSVHGRHISGTESRPLRRASSVIVEAVQPAGAGFSVRYREAAGGELQRAGRKSFLREHPEHSARVEQMVAECGRGGRRGVSAPALMRQALELRGICAL